MNDKIFRIVLSSYIGIILLTGVLILLIGMLSNEKSSLKIIDSYYFDLLLNIFIIEIIIPILFLGIGSLLYAFLESFSIKKDDNYKMNV